MSPKRSLFLLALLGTASNLASSVEWPDPAWGTSTPAAQGMNVSYLKQARDFALRGGGSGMIVRRGYFVYSWGSLTTRYDVKSTTKSFGATALGLALIDGRVSLSGHARAPRYARRLRGTPGHSPPSSSPSSRRRRPRRQPRCPQRRLR